jgi:hypothetical protein
VPGTSFDFLRIFVVIQKCFPFYDGGPIACSVCVSSTRFPCALGLFLLYLILLPWLPTQWWGYTVWILDALKYAWMPTGLPAPSSPFWCSPRFQADLFFLMNISTTFKKIS